MNQKDLKKYVNELPELEYLVLTWKFGLDGYKPLNNIQIARKLELPVDVIESIENSAIKTLRLVEVDKSIVDFEDFNLPQKIVILLMFFALLLVPFMLLFFP